MSFSQKNIRPATKPQPDIPTKVYSIKTNIIEVDSIYVDAVDGEELTVFMPETLIRIRLKGKITKQPEGIPYFEKVHIIENLVNWEERNSISEIHVIPEISITKTLKSPFFKEDKEGNVLFDFKTEFVFRPSSWGPNEIVFRCGNAIAKKTIIQKKR